jgi:hypothetical protein
MTDEERKEWWCPKCRDEIDGSHVTFDEVHEVCGYRMLDYNPDAELKRLREAVDALQVNLRIFIHAHETGNSVPIFVVKDAEECCRRAKEG